MYKNSNKNPLLILAGLSLVFSSLVLGFIGGRGPKVSAESSSYSSNSISSSLISSSSTSYSTISSIFSPSSYSSSSSYYKQDCEWAITIFGYTYYVIVPCGTPLSISTDGPTPLSSYSSMSSIYTNSSGLDSSSSSMIASPSTISSSSSMQNLSSSTLSSNSVSLSSSIESISSLPSSSSLSSGSLISSSYSSLQASSLQSSSVLSITSSLISSCPVVINNSDFYYKGGNVSVSNFGPISLNNVAIKIILPNGVTVSSSSGTSYLQTGNILRFYIPTIGGYTNVDTSYIHDYLGFYPITTTIECNQSKPISTEEFFKEVELMS